MKARPEMFQAVAALVGKGLSPSRAAKSLRLSPDTVSRWRRERPAFSEMIDEAESNFIGRMTACIEKAAAKDWRAAEALLARRFPAEFARDNAAVQFALNVNTSVSAGGLDDALQLVRESPEARRLLEKMLGEAAGGRVVDVQESGPEGIS